MRKLLCLLLLIGSLTLFGQEPSIKVSTRRQVSVGEQFQVAFELNAEGKKFTAPTFEGFSLVGGPFSSTSSSVQIVNGSMTRTVKNTYTYVLRADSEGKFTIQPASFVVDGKTIKSEPFQVEVVAGSANSSMQQSGSSSTGGSSSSTQSSNDPKVSGQDLFLKVIPSKKSVYVGEPVMFTYKLYTRVPVSQLSVSRMPSYGGFWMKDVSDSGSLPQSSEYVNGVEYSTAEIRKVVLIPQKSGKLPIDPMAIECIAQIRTQSSGHRSNDPFEAFFNDPFFNRSYSNVQKTLETSTMSYEVRSLPNDGRPSSFSGAVGSYSFVASIDRNEASTNEAITLSLSVSGSGNVELLELPQPVFPPDFEVYDPKITSSVQTNNQGMSGTKKAEYLIIPRRAGDFTIPAMEFAYFNPAKGSYETIMSDRFNVKVEKGAGYDDSEGGIYASNQEGVKYLGSDIRHIMAESGNMRPQGSYFFASAPYFIIVLLLLVVAVVLYLVLKKHIQDRQDVVKTRNRHATKVAKGRLKKANDYLKTQDQSHFYEEMSQALWGYISDKLGIERSVLSMDTVKSAMMEKGVSEALSDEFVEVLNTCEFARFAPGDAASKMSGLYEKGLNMIMKVEKVL